MNLSALNHYVSDTLQKDDSFKGEIGKRSIEITNIIPRNRSINTKPNYASYSVNPKQLLMDDNSPLIHMRNQNISKATTLPSTNLDASVINITTQD